MAPLRVSVVILTYNGDVDGLRRAVDSAVRSEGVTRLGEGGLPGSAELVEVLVADNARDDSAVARSIVHAAAQVSPSVAVRSVRFDRNHGFAGGINRAVAACDPATDTVFLLNDDAELEPSALAAACRRLATEDADCLGVAVKMLLVRHPGHLDGVGMAVNEAGEAFNIGIGQRDLGQYDESEATLGPCFGAALLRRDAFDDAHVGPLEESFFLYYEDVEWNLRANLFGYRFVTAPDARVHHVNSGSTRHLDYGFKFRHNERNLLCTAAIAFEGRRAVSIWLRRGGGLTRRFLMRGDYARDGLRALTGAVARLPRTLRRRRHVQRRRVIAHQELFRFAQGELMCLDPITYEPLATPEALAAPQRRLERLRRERRLVEQHDSRPGASSAPGEE